VRVNPFTLSVVVRLLFYARKTGEIGVRKDSLERKRDNIVWMRSFLALNLF
jgi:hypothetical protein